MSQLSLEPLYLIDENLSPSLAPVFAAVGYKVTSVKQAFSGRSGVSDEEIIRWLSERGRQNAVWVTADEDARRVHEKLIHAANISVLWILRPRRRGLTGLQELQLLSLVIEKVTATVAEAQHPVYLRASLNVRRPKLEQLVRPLTSSRLEFRGIRLAK